MLTPVPWNLTLYPGFTFNPAFTFYTDQARTQPFNLTGYTAQLTIGNGLLVLTSSSGLTLGGALGTVQVLATPTQTTPIPAGTQPWFLQWTSAGGEVDCPVSGQLNVVVP